MSKLNLWEKAFLNKMRKEYAHFQGAPSASKGSTPNRYMPHQGKKEIARRLRRLQP